MFIFDSVVEDILNNAIDWFYKQILDFATTFLSGINQMGVELFQLPWIDSYLEYVRLVGWALFIVGLVVAVFEVALEYSNGSGDLKSVLISGIKGMLAVSLFTTLPIEMYKFTVTLQGSLTNDILMNTPIGDSALEAIKSLSIGTTSLTTLLFMILLLYAVVCIFLANLKRGGILLMLITLGVFHVFSLPRSYSDAFISWCKQILALCFTTFMQTILLSLGLIVISENMLLGIGITLAAGEVPRIAERFGMDTSVKTSIGSSIHSISSAVSLTRMIRKVA